MSELLKVLDMNEEDRWVWLRKKVGRFHSLADLAFRLRDEVVKENQDSWLKGCYVVDCKTGNYGDGRIYTDNNGLTAESNILRAKPIYWIIAALIAKEMSK